MLPEDPSVVELLWVKEQQLPIATMTLHRRQYRTNQYTLGPIHELIHQSESLQYFHKASVKQSAGHSFFHVEGYSVYLEPILPGVEAQPWSQGYRGSEAHYTPTEKEILAAYKGVRAASEIVGTEAQLLLALRLPVLHWIFKGRVPSTHHATDTTWSKWVAFIMQKAPMGNPNYPGILEEIMDWPEGRDFRASPEEVTHAQETTPYNDLKEDERHYALFTNRSCCVETIRSGKLLCGVPHDKLQKLSKEKANRVSLQK
ncbi:LOW QUALITY PROTEIN: hypothetical protein QYF61_012653 [Mycteria americana]|uniref:Uncharacterized protein n=1 Tax=Mycteria americana TaxID=33587 RepID=A0AAN7MZV7_MYCAM|nr:LOW QUALITY PROTEIN: hypothetical protein QYF61_012653 [Mycteria americana]